MTKQNLLESIILDLGDNYRNDNEIIGAILDEVVNDALIVSGRDQFSNTVSGLETQLDVLSSNIRKAVKSIYLLRGGEDVKSQSVSGMSATFENAIETMNYDIIRTGKRVLR
jgi:hypothetical protein